MRGVAGPSSRLRGFGRRLEPAGRCGPEKEPGGGVAFLRGAERGGDGGGPEALFGYRAAGMEDGQALADAPAWGRRARWSLNAGGKWSGCASRRWSVRRASARLSSKKPAVGTTPYSAKSKRCSL